ncbi:RNA polymerase sigma-70 factor, ECF subfamily [Chitinophaga ginsengisegetis]|jgi:RNA polymerase sigma-19 factor, ECF subfamily|uniref:RNA polymerase sigma-70 factor, ECF subfamily n=1 Tax=Chitinophaga ginsengisegetis TaxID=393003 RepID=A0A1T5P8K3_9BACT|nr:sigma-70 family RNA polymerase sigma factor [Chitinophaga ginsengisegetis]MDR6568132.1 RNA polymerase sigma-70 factor (ECF subfamily) [Chitinophaga ginsengisegetis]MDR6647313.1 RNA polymerase sigma-70 factor (ECF subfamily) [Chitinophaga ginsengisegetis]MDR6653662.1 RNA polymerase sigma-70 factor (ECF subfamily) [Chitinophaga ginsengisegetis]SKD09080.1 RNA polymerase sigma-70 factor, ECF subfamily [Chitinophaga ginsengisegetis]
MNNNDDGLLLHQLKEGDIKAYEQLFKKYYKSLNVDAYYLLKDETEAEDQVQSLFIEIWDKQLYLNITYSVKSYLHTAIRNKCLSFIEKGKNEHKRFHAYANTLEDKINENIVENKETAQQIDLLLNELPNQRLRAFSLVYLEDKKYKEAAEEMGITINSVKTHLKLALKILQKKFAGYK